MLCQKVERKIKKQIIKKKLFAVGVNSGWCVCVCVCVCVCMPACDTKIAQVFFFIASYLPSY